MSSEVTQVTAESPSASSKRPYTRRVPLCRLCLQQYPKDQLEEIFGRGSDCKKRIFAAVAIKPNRNDRSTRLCPSCRNMVDVIVTFQQMCHQTDSLLHKGHILGGTGWQHASKLIGSVREIVEQHRNSVHNTDNVTIETDQEIFKVSVPEATVEYLDEVKDEQRLLGEFNEELKTETSCELEVKEEEHLEDETDHLPSDSHEQESDQESVEEEQPKKKRRGGRKKLDMTKRMMKSEKVICDTCGELVSQISLEGHLNRHLGVKPFVCEIEGCGRQLYSKYSLQQHRHLHKSIMRYYDCPDCGKRIKGTNCWLRHKKLHTEEPKFTCDVCGKKFRRRFGLKIHSVVHTGVALYPCEICGKHFTVKHNLGAHYRTHMKNGTHPGMNKREPVPQQPTCSVQAAVETVEQIQLPSGLQVTYQNLQQ